MEIIITQWALNSYLNLRAQQVFTATEYWQEIRPDVLLLAQYPSNIKFKQSKFWSIAKDNADQAISDGYKMKWHQVGQGKIQLRLPVGVLNVAFLCEAYVKQNAKQNAKQEKRQLAKFKVYLQLIRKNKYVECGRLK